MDVVGKVVEVRDELKEQKKGRRGTRRSALVSSLETFALEPTNSTSPSSVLAATSGKKSFSMEVKL